jgi:hypothetical protein
MQFFGRELAFGTHGIFMAAVKYYCTAIFDGSPPDSSDLTASALPSGNSALLCV